MHKAANLVALFLGCCALLTSGTSEARGGSGGHSGGHASARASGGSHSVRSHVTRAGTYVRSHRATNRDTSKRNNWLTRGNVNPYTGKPGTKPP